MALTTMQVLPDLGDRRFGSLALGYDKIMQIRVEHSALAALAAAACECEVEDLTILKIQQVTAALASAKNAATDAAGVDGSTM